MMQLWADQLDELREGGKVLEFKMANSPRGSAVFKPAPHVTGFPPRVSLRRLADRGGKVGLAHDDIPHSRLALARVGCDVVEAPERTLVEDGLANTHLKLQIVKIKRCPKKSCIHGYTEAASGLGLFTL
jgi:hypothetical protein